MLVTFESNAYGNIMMFGDVAIRLIKMMGHSGTVPSAILADDVPAALSNLLEGVYKEKQYTSSSRPVDAEDEVSLAHRALPLIALLESAVSNKCDVLWK